MKFQKILALIMALCMEASMLMPAAFADEGELPSLPEEQIEQLSEENEITETPETPETLPEQNEPAPEEEEAVPEENGGEGGQPSGEDAEIPGEKPADQEKQSETQEQSDPEDSFTVSPPQEEEQECAFHIGGTDFASLQEAVSAAGNDQVTIEIDRMAGSSEPVFIGKDQKITLHFNDNGPYGFAAYYGPIVNYGELTIDGSYESSMYSGSIVTLGYRAGDDAACGKTVILNGNYDADFVVGQRDDARLDASDSRPTLVFGGSSSLVSAYLIDIGYVSADIFNDNGEIAYSRDLSAGTIAIQGGHFASDDGVISQFIPEGYGLGYDGDFGFNGVYQAPGSNDGNVNDAPAQENAPVPGNDTPAAVPQPGEAQKYKVTVTFTEGGTVLNGETELTSSPAVISIPSDGSVVISVLPDTANKYEIAAVELSPEDSVKNTGGQVFTFDDGMDYSINAVFVKTVYEVKFDYANNDYNPSASDIQTQEIDKNGTVELPLVSRSGYQLSGWLCEEDGETYPVGRIINVDSSKVFKAQWTALMEMEVNIISGSGKVRYNGTDYSGGESFYVPADSSPEITLVPDEGFIAGTFGIGANGEFTSYTIEDTITVNSVDSSYSTVNVTFIQGEKKPLTAMAAPLGLDHIVAVTAESHGTVKYKIGTDGTETDLPADGKITVDDGKSIKFIITPATGYTIDKVTVDGAEIASPYEIPAVTADKAVTVAFKPDSGFWILEYEPANGEAAWTKPVVKGDKAVAEDAPVRTGYTFKGWKSGENSYNPGQEIEVTGNMALVAQWEATVYHINYVLDGGKMPAGAPATYTIESGETILLVPSKLNADFDGWYLNSSFTGSPVSSIPAGSTGDKTFYAKWINYYKISVYYNDYGYVTYGGSTVASGSSITLPQGSNATFNFVCTASGYGVYNCTVNGIRSGSVTSYTVSDLNQNTTVVVTFARSTLRPITGDDSNVLLWAGIMAASAAVLAGAVIITKKRKKK